VTYLVVELRLDVPLGVFEELVDVLAKHALKVAILKTFLGFTFWLRLNTALTVGLL